MKSAFPLRNPKEHSNFTLENSSLLLHLTMGVGALIMSVSSSRRQVGWQASQGKASQACCDKRQCLLAWSPTHPPEEEKSVQWRTWGWARMKVALLILLASLFLAEAKQRFPAKVIHCILIRTRVQLMLFRDHHFTFWWDYPIISRKFTATVFFVMPLRYHCTYPYS